MHIIKNLKSELLGLQNLYTYSEEWEVVRKIIMFQDGQKYIKYKIPVSCTEKKGMQYLFR